MRIGRLSAANEVISILRDKKISSWTKEEILKHLSGKTEFEKAVLMATLEIPEGKVSTYKRIAKRIGRPNAYRAVATLDGNAGLSSPISYRFARAPFISVIDYLDGKILDLKIIPNSLASGGGGVGIALAQWILSIGANAVLGSRFGPNLIMVLRQGNINPVIVGPGIPLG